MMLLCGALGLAALLWASRGASLGTVVADDYFFLTGLHFQPLDPFNSMGVAYYWRPLSRQLYFGCLGPLMFSVPWATVLLHLALLFGLFVVLQRVLRHGFSPALATAIAIFPLLSEPARVLVAWPSGSQHLLPALMAAVVLHEAIEGRMVTSALAALAAVLSHESGVLAIPMLPLVAWYRTRRPPEVLRWSGAALGVVVVWAMGYVVAFRHGVILPTGHGYALPPGQIPALYGRAILALLNLEDLPPAAAASLLATHLLLLVVALLLLWRKRMRTGAPAQWPTVVFGVLWFGFGTLLLAFLPDWNSWRAWYPALGFGVAATAVFALASPALAAAFVALRLVALLVAPAAPDVVTPEPAVTTSKMSFARLTRLQLTVSSTRSALISSYPRLPHGARVRFWAMPRAAQLGFQDSLAVRVWYQDTTVSWGRFGGVSGLTQHVDAMLEYFDNERSPAAVIEAPAFLAFQHSGLAVGAGDEVAADSLLSLAEREHRLQRGAFFAAIESNRAFVAYRRGDPARAETLIQRSLAADPKVASAWALAAELALTRNDRRGAATAIRRSLEIDPRNPEARRLAASLDGQ